MYTIKGYNLTCRTISYESKSRNARKHLIENDMIAVSVYDKKGQLISHAETYAGIVLVGALKKDK